MPLDGYVEKPARVSSTSLASVARNRYSVPCELVGQARAPDKRACQSVLDRPFHGCRRILQQQKGADVDVLRQMVHFMAQRLLELDVQAVASHMSSTAITRPLAARPLSLVWDQRDLV